jgi:hypothetical protein
MNMLLLQHGFAYYVLDIVKSVKIFPCIGSMRRATYPASDFPNKTNIISTNSTEMD